MILIELSNMLNLFLVQLPSLCNVEVATTRQISETKSEI